MRPLTIQKNNEMLMLISRVGNVNRAAKKLGVSRQALDCRISRYNLRDDVKKIILDFKREQDIIKMKANLIRCRICNTEFLPRGTGNIVVCSVECRKDYYTVRFIFNGQTKVPTQEQWNVLDKIFKARGNNSNFKEPLPPNYFNRAKKVYEAKVIRARASVKR